MYYEINVDYLYVSANFLCEAKHIFESQSGLPIFQYLFVYGKTAMLRPDIEPIRNL